MKLGDRVRVKGERDLEGEILNFVGPWNGFALVDFGDVDGSAVFLKDKLEKVEDWLVEQKY